MTKRKQFDRSRPGAKELSDKIVHGAFVTEGTMIAFPACFPGVTVSVPADESRITALDVAESGIVYAGTSGRRAHLLVGMFHGVTGMVFDMGVVDGADHCAAICCTREKVVAAVNGPAGGRIVMRELQGLPFDLIQEWHIARKPYQYLDEIVKGEKILHAVTDASGRKVIGVTEKHLFSLDIKSAETRVVGEIPGKPRLALGPKECIFGLDEHDSLWRYDPESTTLTRKAIGLPSGKWEMPTLMWAKDRLSGRLYTADADGVLFSFAEDEGFIQTGATAPLAPVGPMAVTLDGRLFGTAGEEMSRLFCYNPDTGQVSNLGVAVSVFERRRYGYTFGDAVVGRDGEIIFGEDDDLGHLWLYFPRIERRSS